MRKAHRCWSHESYHVRFPSERVFVRFKNLDEHHAGAFAAEVRGAPSLPQSCRRVNASREPKHAGQVRNCSHSCDNALVVVGGTVSNRQKDSWRSQSSVSLRAIHLANRRRSTPCGRTGPRDQATGAARCPGLCTVSHPPASTPSGVSRLARSWSRAARPDQAAGHQAAFTASSVGRKGELQRMRQHPEFR